MRASERGSHSSGTALARRLTQPTRMTGPETGCGTASGTRVIPIRSCSRWGLPCRSCCQSRGGLLPHPFTLTPPTLRSLNRAESRRGGLLSVALSLRSPSPDVIRHRVSVEPGLSSPYRLSALVKRGCPANWRAGHSLFAVKRPQQIRAREKCGFSPARTACAPRARPLRASCRHPRTWLR